MEVDENIKFADIKELATHVKEHGGGVESFPMSVVRDAYGASRLGSTVRENISNELQQHAISHHPVELPDSQNDWVRLYHSGSDAALLIQAVMKPGTEGDEEVRRRLSDEDSALLVKIKELIGD